jgi:hypothetical protein
MPSLLSTTVAANYGRMVPQQTYGVGENQTNFGTRQLVLIKVLIGGTAADMRYQDGATSASSFNLTNSCYSAAVRSLQAFGEVYAVYTPVATGFIALMALDTLNSAESANGTNPIATTYGIAEAAVAAAIDAAKASATKDSTCTITVPTVAIGTTL